MTFEELSTEIYELLLETLIYCTNETGGEDEYTGTYQALFQPKPLYYEDRAVYCRQNGEMLVVASFLNTFPVIDSDRMLADWFNRGYLSYFSDRNFNGSRGMPLVTKPTRQKSFGNMGYRNCYKLNPNAVKSYC